MCSWFASVGGQSDVLKVLNVKIMHYVFDMDIIYTLNMNIYKYPIKKLKTSKHI